MGNVTMAKRKDKIRKRQLLNDKTKEVELLEKIQDLPPELIRIIFSYMSGNAKLICNYKFDSLARLGFCPYDIKTFIYKLPKKKVLDLIHKGILRKFPEIIDSFKLFCYCKDIQHFAYVRGRRMVHLWETDGLIYNLSGIVTDPEEDTQNLDRWTKHSISIAISRYICKIVNCYQMEKNKIILVKNSTYLGNSLFLELDKVFHLYKCLEYYYKKCHLRV
jgi:hypothetical protein